MRNYIVSCGLTGLLFCLSCLTALSQAPNWQWVRTASGGVSDFGRALAADAQGNLYVAGTYLSSNFNLGGNALPNASMTHQVFLAKYTANGTLLWVRNAGGAGINLAYGVTADAQGNAIIVGTSGTNGMQFGALTATAALNNGIDLFVAKYSPTGTPLWARRAGGLGEDQANAVSADAAGNVYVAGHFASSTLSFIGSPLTITKFNTGPALDAFVLKYDAAGTLLWARGIGGAAEEKTHAIAADAAGNVTVTGYYGSPSVAFGSTTLTNPGVSYQGFLARYNSTGTAQWARAIGGNVRAEVTAVAVDAQGAASIVGFFNGGTVGFGSGMPSFQPIGGADCFAAKYNAAGVPQWAQQVGGASGEGTSCVALDASGGVYMGAVVGSVFLTFGGVTYRSVGSSDHAIFKFNAQGIPQWARYGGNPFYNYSNGIAVGPSGQVYLAGSYEAPTATFGSTTLTNTNTATSGRSADYILLSLPSTLTATRGAFAAQLLACYPNPATELVTLQLPDAGSEPWQLYLIDAQGRQVYQSVTPQSKIISLLGHSPGLYTIQLRNSKHLLIGRVVLQ